VLKTLAMFCHFALKPQEESQMKPAGRELVLCNSDKTEEKLVLNQETPPLMRTILLKKPHFQTALVLKVKFQRLTAKNQKLRSYAQETKCQNCKKVKKLTALLNHYALRIQECQLVNAGPQALSSNFVKTEEMCKVMLLQLENKEKPSNH